MGTPVTSSKGIISTLFLLLASSGMPLFLHPSLLERSLLPNLLPDCKYCPSVCRGCGPQSQSTKVPSSSLKPAREGVKAALPCSTASPRLPLADRQAECRQQWESWRCGPGVHRPPPFPRESAFPVAPPCHFADRRGQGRGCRPWGQYLISPGNGETQTLPTKSAHGQPAPPLPNSPRMLPSSDTYRLGGKKNQVKLVFQVISRDLGLSHGGSEPKFGGMGEGGRLKFPLRGRRAPDSNFVTGSQRPTAGAPLPLQCKSAKISWQSFPAPPKTLRAPASPTSRGPATCETPPQSGTALPAKVLFGQGLECPGTRASVSPRRLSLHHRHTRRGRQKPQPSPLAKERRGAGLHAPAHWGPRVPLPALLP